ncbi:alpha/beta hydrolase [Leptospira kmetyi]|uniref:Alpha/beta hydrolase n=1 Tax=Leptospira kmetyi TaxID=408139 RepID=A0ABX4NAI8_9LEPT|nr:alpha/beta hydrolase [Leptospira kmetyi]PJZ30205.1 alpha/beta hydrolase [Leptospira kmetyi]TGK17008.1 alpha/beta hydrolase [Leptospira kmetyi]TGK32901.1 alpha/beta hydrolase [Leptospira kmetyi]TGL70396.1 alpha/beta hydrolase [Leptospira kmetyi]
MTFHHKEFYILSSSDKSKLYCQSWTKPNANRVMIFHHGFGEHSGRYTNLLRFFAKSDINFYSFDMRGHGNSEGKRGHADSFDLYVRDLSDFANEVLKRERKDRFFLLGHSLGGAITLRYSQEGINQDNILGLILGSPALRVRMDFKKNLKRIVAGFLSKISPATIVDAELDLQYLSHDPEVIEAYQQDPLVHGKVSLKMGTELLEIGPKLIKKANVLRCPVLILHGQEDGLIDYNGSTELYKNLIYRNKRIKIYPGLYHELMNEFPEHREVVLGDIRDFLETIQREKISSDAKDSSLKMKKKSVAPSKKKSAV